MEKCDVTVARLTTMESCGLNPVFDPSPSPSEVDGPGTCGRVSRDPMECVLGDTEFRWMVTRLWASNPESHQVYGFVWGAPVKPIKSWELIWSTSLKRGHEWIVHRLPW